MILRIFPNHESLIKIHDGAILFHVDKNLYKWVLTKELKVDIQSLLEIVTSRKFLTTSVGNKTMFQNDVKVLVNVKADMFVIFVKDLPSATLSLSEVKTLKSVLKDYKCQL